MVPPIFPAQPGAQRTSQYAFPVTWIRRFGLLYFQPHSSGRIFFSVLAAISHRSDGSLKAGAANTFSRHRIFKITSLQKLDVN